jgi:histone deacetylase 8
MNAQDCPPFHGLPDYVQLIGGATLTAVSALRNDVSNIAICWDGGRLFVSFCFRLISKC